MDYKTIEDEVFEFSADYFDDIATLAEENETFVQEHDLHIPKENYTILNKFLQKTLNNFKILDQTYCSNTLDKLSFDLEQICFKFDSVIKNSHNTKDIFDKKFLPTSPTLVNFAKATIDFAELPHKTTDEILYLKQMKKDYLKLKEVYFTIFEEIFNDDKKHYLTSLKYGINTKSYYFDKLLWKEADQSITIVKHFSIRKLEGKLNTKDYILFTTALMRPYTDEYRYLQKCLRIFK